VDLQGEGIGKIEHIPLGQATISAEAIPAHMILKR
jgi:hypothetical protein